MSAAQDRLISHYALSHRHPRNELIHCVCVPAIAFAVVGLLCAASIWLALAGFAAAMTYYARLGARPLLEMFVLFALMLLVWVFFLPHHRLPIALAIFVIAWAGQFIGHYYEGVKPSFTEDLQYLLVGPLYVLGVLRRLTRNEKSGPAPGA